VAEQNGRCADCYVSVGKSLSVHHIRPFRLFRTASEANARDNLIGLCQSCHMAIEARTSERHARRIEDAYKQADLFVEAPVPEDPAEARLRDLFAEPEG
jgi:5-methylcytosine-specific restriction endonuclease McrA